MHVLLFGIFATPDTLYLSNLTCILPHFVLFEPLTWFVTKLAPCWWIPFTYLPMIQFSLSFTFVIIGQAVLPLNHLEGLVQNCSNSSALAMELLQYCTKPSIWRALPVHEPYEAVSLTHWGWVMHICVCNLTIIGSDKGLSPGWCQVIIWPNAGILSIGPIGTNFSEILVEIQTFSFMKMCLKVLSVKWRPFCLGLKVVRNRSARAKYNHSNALIFQRLKHREWTLIKQLFLEHIAF